MLGKLMAPTVTPVTSTVCEATSRPSASSGSDRASPPLEVEPLRGVQRNRDLVDGVVG